MCLLVLITARFFGPNTVIFHLLLLQKNNNEKYKQQQQPNIFMHNDFVMKMFTVQYKNVLYKYNVSPIFAQKIQKYL